MMRLKVSLFDKQLIKNYLAVLSVIGLVFSFALIVITIPDKLKICIGISLFLLFLIIYIGMWIYANLQSSAILNINKSKIEIKIGNILEEDGLKVIAFNEYLDTQVDNRIISESSLNGIYIKSKINDVAVLDTLMDSDDQLNRKVVRTNNRRSSGKKKIYKLGTIYQQDEFLLTAFSKFDAENRAYLSMQDYIDFLINFWNEIDIIYAGRSVSIPLLGSGITRFKEYNCISEQELLELLIWSFKISRIKFAYPSKVSIIIHESKKDKIDFYKLKNL